MIHRAPVGSEADAAIHALADGIADPPRRREVAPPIAREPSHVSRLTWPIVLDPSCEPIARANDRAVAYALAAFVIGATAGALFVGTLVALSSPG